MNSHKYRLVTRSDMDGLVCGVLLKYLHLIDDILFVHPKDMQDGKIAITERDITTNLPYVPNVHLAFDHHVSEISRIKTHSENYIIDPAAPSAARVVFDYYGGVRKFGENFQEMMIAVDKADSADFALEEVRHPSGWTLLDFVLDPRTGLGRFKSFRISNYKLMEDLIEYLYEHVQDTEQTIERILDLPDIKARTALYFLYEKQAIEQIHRCANIHRKLIVLDLRKEPIIYPTNRFMVYALYPICNVSMHILWGKDRQNIVFAVGKSIFDRSATINIGELMLKYGGGGHHAAGTCQIPVEDTPQVLPKLIELLTYVPPAKATNLLKPILRPLYRWLQRLYSEN